jgi:hypothetical protein
MSRNVFDEIDVALTKACRLSTNGKKTLQETVAVDHDVLVQCIRGGEIDQDKLPQNLRQYLPPHTRRSKNK